MVNRNEPLATLDHVAGAAEAWALSEERIPVFAVRRATHDYDDEGNPVYELIEYGMPAKPNPGLALLFLKKARTEGELAMAWLIETAVGEEGYDALTEDLIAYDGNAVDLLRQIVERIQRVAMGGLDPKA